MLIEEIYHQNVCTIGENATVESALEMLETHKHNGLVVVDNKERVVGVLSIQDIAGATVPLQFRENTSMAAAMYRKGYFHERVLAIKDKPVREIMRRDFTHVTLRSNIMEVAADFLYHDLYIVPVMKESRVLGVITRTEIKDALLMALKHEV